MEPVTTVCEHCGGTRYSDDALKYTVQGKTIIDVLNMSVEEAVPFFANNKKISAMLDALTQVVLSYISLGQPLSTFSGDSTPKSYMISLTFEYTEILQYFTLFVNVFETRFLVFANAPYSVEVAVWGR